MLITNAPKGTKDVLPQESYQWHYLEEKARETCRLFGFREVRVPTFEHTELFLRSVGDTTDIVQMEMYTFEDKGGRSITLKPEGTAGVARCFVQNKLFNEPLPQKMYYLSTPVFRYERPQAGRLREHHQFGVEVFGASHYTMDAEVIGLAVSFLSSLGLGHMVVHINSIGCPECRQAYQTALREFIAQREDQMCETCRQRMERNPLRILDCKVPTCQQALEGAPRIIDYLCEDCAQHFEGLKTTLDALQIPYEVDPGIVRGLDYYTRTVFEIIAPEIGAKSAVCAGGRYDKLLSEVGGPDLPGVGFGLGMERLLIALQAKGHSIPEPDSRCDVFVVTGGEDAVSIAMPLVMRLRKQGISADLDHQHRSMKAQFKYADKLGARIALTLGEDELQKGTVRIKDMHAGSEEEQRLEFLEDVVSAMLCQEEING